ncbi:MAG: FAD-binding oxidoreductase [Paracoccaceae bacterium]|nr:FAD-binding oxidoreductase [Paracoccaceae bacterium]
MIEITVRGAGIFGLSIAWACAVRGARVQVVDPNGVGGGASGGIVGALAPHVPENWNPKKAFQFESLIAAKGFWESIEDIGGVSSGYARLGRIQPIMDNVSLELAKKRAETAKDLWRGLAEWRVTAKQPEWAPASATGYWIIDTLTARINPMRACHAIEASLLAKGITVTPEAKDKGKVLWATGTHDLFQISKELGKNFGNGVKGQAALFDLDRRHHPQVFADALHFVPHEDGTLAIGSTSEREYETEHGVDEQLETLIAKASCIMPELASAQIIARWAALRPRARSRAPIVGHHPVRKDAFIANGGFKIGFGMAPGLAMLMANLMLEGRNEIPEAFRPETCL